jgi:ABC-type transport system involved in cytochrome c biogenesis permease subunit
MTAGIETVLAVGATTLYGAASVLAVLSLVRPGARRERGALLLLAGGALPLLAVLVIRGIRAGCIPSFGWFDALACYTMAATGVYLFTMARRYTPGIAGLIIPYLTAILLCGTPALRPEVGPPPSAQGLWLALHVVAAFTAYAVFTLGSVLAAAYLVQDHNLKHKYFGAVWERLPSLEALDHLMSRLMGLAFLLLSVSIILGFVLVHRTGGGDEWFTDPKVAATLATWVLFAVLVHMRASADRHGRGVALVTVAGLACLLFAFVGVHLIADSVHAFLQIRMGLTGP